MAHDSDQMKPIIGPAIKALERVFNGSIEPEDVTVARLANGVLATWSRLKQSERAQEGIYFAVARELAADREQLAKYVAVTMPDLPIVERIAAPKRK